MDNGKSSVPAGCPKPLFALFQSRMISSLIQDPKSLQCKNCILRLVGAGKRKGIFLSFIAETLSGKIRLQNLCFGYICHTDIRACLCPCLLYNLQGLRLLSDRHHAASRFNDPGLFLGDLGNRISKEGLMIHTDRHKHCKLCCSDQICGIGDTAHSDLQNDRITFFLCKKQKCHRRFDFKWGGMRKTFCGHFFNHCGNPRRLLGKLFPADRLSFCFDLFPIGIHRRRDIPSNMISGFHQRRI